MCVCIFLCVCSDVHANVYLCVEVWDYVRNLSWLCPILFIEMMSLYWTQNLSTWLVLGTPCLSLLSTEFQVSCHVPWPSSFYLHVGDSNSFPHAFMVGKLVGAVLAQWEGVFGSKLPLLQTQILISNILQNPLSLVRLASGSETGKGRKCKQLSVLKISCSWELDSEPSPRPQMLLLFILWYKDVCSGNRMLDAHPQTSSAGNSSWPPYLPQPISNGCLEAPVMSNDVTLVCSH